MKDKKNLKFLTSAKGKFQEGDAEKAMGRNIELRNHKKNTQKELAQALLNAFSSINPTIIQAQRI